MLSPLFKSLILLAITTAAQAADIPADGHWTRAAVNDWVPSGNYLIYSCGSQAPTVKSLLDYTWLFLQTALLSTNTLQYRAFFKYADPSFVKTILTSITLGTNITVSEHVSHQLTFICVNQGDPSLEPMWQACLNNANLLTASQYDPPAIFLCPNFFRITMAPVFDDCPIVNSARTGFSRNLGNSGVGLNRNQYKFAVQALAKHYIREALGLDEFTKLKDIGGEGPCVRLSEYDSLRNPSSHAYFAACECWLSFLHSFNSLILSFKQEKLMRVRDSRSSGLHRLSNQAADSAL